MNNKPVALKFPTMLRKMWSGGEVQTWLDELPPLYTHPVKELTDEEIEEVWIQALKGEPKVVINFAKAILRKAQEK